MRFISTLNGIGRSDLEKFGVRACDISILKEKGFNIPLTFVVGQDAFDEFVSQNGLFAKMQKIVSEKPVPSEAYAEIVGLFVKSPLPKDLQNELAESYESLSIELGANASSLIREHDFPFVTLVRSPSYLLHHDDHEGIIDNVKGLEQLELGIKLSWSTLYSPESRIYRENNSLSEKFSNCIIIQKMKKPSYSAQTYSRTDFNEFLIRVKSFKGMQDYPEAILGKDVHDVDSNSLLIRSTSVNVQEYEISRDFDTEELVKKQILSGKQEQKLNEKVISECARLTKRAKSIIGKDVKLYLSLSEESISILQVNRLMIDSSKQVSIVQEISSVEGTSGETEVTEIDKITVRQLQASEEKLEMPSLISGDEAKQLVETELKHKVFTLDGFDVEKEIQEISNDVNVPEADYDIEVFENTPITNTIEPPAINNQQQINLQSDLIGEVMLIKEITDKMEEFAQSGNKEAYEREGRKLKALLARINPN